MRHCESNVSEITASPYPTGQNYSSELMFAKFATVKNCEKLNQLTFSSSGAICLKTTLEKFITVKRVHSDWDDSDYKAGYRSDALSLNYRAS